MMAQTILCATSRGKELLNCREAWRCVCVLVVILAVLSPVVCCVLVVTAPLYHQWFVVCLLWRRRCITSGLLYACCDRRRCITRGLLCVCCDRCRCITSGLLCACCDSCRCITSGLLCVCCDQCHPCRCITSGLLCFCCVFVVIS